MNKQIEYQQKDLEYPLIQFVNPEEGLEKTASVGYSPEIVDFVSGLEKKGNSIYALVNALTAGEYFGCFFEGEQVSTRDGYKNIEDIETSDKVLTIDNSFQKVVNTFKKNYTGNICSLDIQNIPGVQKSTEHHPFLVLDKEKAKDVKNKYVSRINKNRDNFYEDLSKLGPEFKDANAIEPGDYIYIPIKPKSNGKKYPIELAYLFGYYLAEGCLAKRYGRSYNDYETIIISMNKDGDRDLVDNLNEISNNLGRKLYIADSNSTDKCYRLELSHKKLAQKLYKLFGIHSKNKFIHPDIFSQSTEWIKTFLGAYLDGDGYINSTSKQSKYKGTIKFSTASENLALSLIRLMASVGIVSSGSTGSNLKKNGCFGKEDNIIYELQIPQFYTKDIIDYTLRLKKNITDFDFPKKTNPGFYILPTGYILAPVKSVSIEKNKKTLSIYNFEVAENNTYTTKILGHNSNKNGDYFPEEALKKYHPTFVDHGHVYAHHVNKDPKKKLGDILFSIYNDKMKRVELVISLDPSHDKVKNILQDLAEGKMPATSMGTKVPYDICSICSNKAKTRKDYCSHLKTQMNSILPDGRRVYANNLTPRFFDISLVTIPADPTSRFMGVFGLDKVANFLDKKSEKDVQAAIEKKVDGEISHVSEDPEELILSSQKKLTQKQIEKLSEYPLRDTLSTFLGMRIIPLREDFQKLALYSMGKRQLADALEKKGHVFQAHPQKYLLPEDVTVDNFNDEIAEVFSKDDIMKMSMLKPLIVSRVLEKTSAELDNNRNIPDYPEQDHRSYLKKFFVDLPTEEDLSQKQRSPVKNPIGPMMGIGALYAGYAKIFGDRSEINFTRFLKKSPWLAPLLAGGVALGSAALQSNHFEKGAAKIPSELFISSLVSTPISYYASGNAERKFQRGERISNTEDFIRKHPFLTSLLGAVGATSLKHGIGNTIKRLNPPKDADIFKKASQLVSRMKPEHVNQLYSDLLK